MKYILTNVNIINGISESLIKGKSVVVKDDIIEDITEDILAYKDYKIIDLTLIFAEGNEQSREWCDKYLYAIL